MTEKWMEVANESIDTGDKEQFEWPGRYNNKEGWIVLSKKKIAFVEEHGFIHKEASLLFDTNYNEISEIRTDGKDQLILKLDGKKESITTPYLTNVKNNLDRLMRQVKEESTAPVAT